MANDNDTDDQPKGTLDGVKKFGSKVLSGAASALGGYSNHNTVKDAPASTMGIRGDNSDYEDDTFGTKDMADGGEVDGDNDGDTSNASEDPSTSAFSKGLDAVNKILMFGRQSYGLPAQPVARLGGTGGGGGGGSGGGPLDSAFSPPDNYGLDRDPFTPTNLAPPNNLAPPDNWGYNKNANSNSDNSSGDNSGSDGDSGSSDSSGGDGSDYARGGLVKNYDDGGEVTDDENDPFDTQNDPQPQQQDQPVNESAGLNTNAQQSDDPDANAPLNDSKAMAKRAFNNYGGDWSGLPRAANYIGKSIMDYLHGSDGWNKQQVDAALAAASQSNQPAIGASNDFARANTSGPTQRDDQDPFDTQNDPSAPRSTPPAVKPASAGYGANDPYARKGGVDPGDPFDTQNDPDAPSAVDPGDPFDTQNDPKARLTSAIGGSARAKPAHIDSKPTPGGASESGFGNSAANKASTDALSKTQPASESGFGDSAANKALADALDRGGVEHGWGLMAGMKKIYNAFMGLAAHAKTPEQASNAVNNAMHYLPGPDDVKAASDPATGKMTVTVRNAQGLRVHELSPEEVSQVIHPAHGLQWDQVMQKGPSQVIDEKKQNPLNNPAAPALQGNTGGMDRALNNWRSQQQQQDDDDDSDLGIPSSARSGPVISGRAPASGYYDDNMGFHQTRPAHNVTFRQKGPDNTDPSRVTIYGRHGVTNGQGEVIDSNDPRTRINRESAERMEIEKQKGETAANLAGIRAGATTGAAQIRAGASTANNQNNNATRQRGQDLSHQDRQAQLEMQRQHFNDLQYFRLNDREGKLAGQLIQANPQLTAMDAVKQARAALRNGSPAPGVGAGPQAPQPPQPQPPQPGGGLQVGQTIKGWTYKGGDPSQQSSWSKAAQ